MPKSKKKTYKLTPAYIEFLHDRGIAIFWPGIEPVGAGECLDDNLLESASEQPFQAGYGVEFYPTIYDKAACLFFSIAGGHIFGNGNKRTAVLALDQFLTANEIYLLLNNDEIRTLAERTASYRERGETVAYARARVLREITQHSVEFRAIRSVNPKMHWTVHHMKRGLRKSLASPGFAKRTPRNPN